MDTFRAVSLTACFLGIVTAIFNAMYPSDKFAGQMKIIFSLIFILCLAKPIAEGKFGFPELSEAAPASLDYYSELNENADEYFIRSVENNISASLTAVLNEAKIYPSEVKTSINISENYSISISEVRMALNDPSEAETAKRLAMEKLGDGVPVIIAAAAESEGLA